MSIELKQAAQQAIEAIQDLRGYRPDIDKAIEALRAAITQAEGEPCKSFTELRDRHREGVDAELAAMAAEAETDERAAFEAEMRCEDVWGHRSLKKRPDGRYQNRQVDLMWDVWQARSILALRPVQVPMTEDQVWHNDALMSANGTAGFKMDALMRIVRAAEAHQGITAQAKKETP